MQKDDQWLTLIPKSDYSLTYFQDLRNTYTHNLSTSQALGFQHRLECNSHLGLNIKHPTQVCLLRHCLETLISPSDVPLEPGCRSPQLVDVIMLCCIGSFGFSFEIAIGWDPYQTVNSWWVGLEAFSSSCPCWAPPPQSPGPGSLSTVGCTLTILWQPRTCKPGDHGRRGTHIA